MGRESLTISKDSFQVTVGTNVPHDGGPRGFHGLRSLRPHGSGGNTFVRGLAGLNHEYIIDGVINPSTIDEPRGLPVELRHVGRGTAELYQPPTPHFGVSLIQEFHIAESDYTDVALTASVSWDRFKHNYAILFFVSYMNDPVDPAIRFIGRRDHPTAEKPR